MVCRLNYAPLLRAIPKAVLASTAQELGLWKSGVLVGDEGDTDILADRMIYDPRWDGRSCIDKVLRNQRA